MRAVAAVTPSNFIDAGKSTLLGKRFVGHRGAGDRPIQSDCAAPSEF
jgi:hypothetical protein